MDSGVLQAIVHEVAQNLTRLKQLSMDAGQMFTHYGKLMCLVCMCVFSVCVCVCACVCECVCVCYSPSRSRLSVIPLTVAQQTPLSMESSRQEY